MSNPTSPRRQLLLASAAAGAAGLVSTGAQAQTRGQATGAVRVVYHVTQGLPQASRCLGNVRNHLAADPTAQIVVVGNGAGIDFMLNGAKDGNGAEYAGAIGDLASHGVSFRVCNNTLVNRKIGKDQVILDASVVPAGVVEVTNLQFRDGYAYICP